MSAGCCKHGHEQSCESAVLHDPVYHRVLWAAFGINAGMFGLELLAGVIAGSASLQADALDFLADAGNYLLSLSVLGMAAAWRARAAMVKGISLGVLGLWVAGVTLYNAIVLKVPSAELMGIVGLLALVANLVVAAMLFAYRNGDANMRSVWICSRNDVLANIAVIAAAFGVFGSGTGWPDVIVASVIAALSLSGALQIARHASGELRPRPASAVPSLGD
jgi:Co/Zn/Cd efflux system component